jgi:hypothetical protein
LIGEKMLVVVVEKNRLRAKGDDVFIGEVGACYSAACLSLGLGLRRLQAQ